jgi:hypothetical protein
MSRVRSAPSDAQPAGSRPGDQLGAESLAPVAQLRALVWKLMLGDPWVAWRDAARGQFLLKLTTASATKRTQAASFVARLKLDQLRVFEMIDGQAAL